MTETNSQDVAAVIALAQTYCQAMVKTEGGWRIIAKTFDVPPQT